MRFTRQHAETLVARRRAGDDDYAELLAVEDRLNDLLDAAERAAGRLNNSQAADQLREFVAVVRDAKSDELTPAFQMLADDSTEAMRRLIGEAAE